MIPIQYKAKSLSNGRWCYGLPRLTPLGNWLMQDDVTKTMTAIDPDTLCQSIGITDMSGNPIYECDVLQIGKGKTSYVVRYNAKSVQFKAYGIEYPVVRNLSAVNSKTYRIIGNIHDNDAQSA